MIPFGVGVRTAVRCFGVVLDSLSPVVALRGAMAALLLGFIPFVPAATPTPAPELPGSVWIVAHKNLFRIDPATNVVIESVPLPYEASAAAVDAGRGHLWVLAHRRLLRLDNTTNINLEIDLKDLTTLYQQCPGGAEIDTQPAVNAFAIDERGVFLKVNGVGALEGGTGHVAPLAANALVGIEDDLNIAVDGFHGLVMDFFAV